MSDPSLRFDLEKIVNGRGGKGRVPRFVINWGKRFIHQDFINGFLEQGYEGVEFCEECMKALDVTVNVEGMENLEGYGDDVRFTFASNHPLGGIDGIAVNWGYRQMAGETGFPVAGTSEALRALLGLA